MFVVCGLCALLSMLVGVRMFRKTQDRFCCILRRKTMEPIIKVDNVSMCFNLSKEKHESLKEYFLAMVQGRLQYDEFYALKE